MAKFTDSPHFVLKDFFDNLSVSRTGTSNAHLRGPNQIITDGGHGIDLYIKNASQFVKIHAYNTDTYLNGNLFEFTFDVNRSDVTDDEFAELSGSEVYIRKTSTFYDYVNSISSLSNYINTNKYLLYFGKMYLTENNDFHVVYVGMKDYVVNALPMHNRTEKLTEFINIYFDEVYNEVYFRTKDVASLTDAHDVPEEYLEHMASTYNDSTNTSMETSILREYVSNIIYFLKRKGTYTDLHIIWKLLLSNTLNTLTILERWHNQDFTGIPIDEFVDVPHTYRYKEYNILPETCAGESWWRRFSYTSTYPYQVYTTDARIWIINHNLNTRHIFVQCYDSDYNQVIPNTITPITANMLEVTFAVAVTGYAFIVKSENTHHQTASSSLWSVDYSPSGSWEQTLQQLEYEDNSKFISDTVNIIDGDTFTATMAESTTGYALQVDPTYRHTEAVASTVWNINHGLNKQAVVVQSYKDDGSMLMPLSVQIDDVNNVTITFDDDVSGYAVIKEMDWGSTPTTYVYDSSAKWLVITPHYKVMMDMSCEATSDTYIIDETAITNLIDKWELLRPVCKYAHYHTLLSPVTNFTGNYVPLYDYTVTNNKGKCETKCCESITNPTAGSYVYKTSSNLPVWIIDHNLDSEHIFVQCYDKNLLQIIPATIEPVNDNITKVTFNYSVSGYAFLSKSEYTHTESPATSAWTIDYSPSGSDMHALVQFEDMDKNVFIPDEITMVDTDTYTGTMSTPASGYATYVEADYVHHQSSASKIWTIYHGLDYQALTTQAYKADGTMVIPISVKINSTTIVLTFDDDITGYAAIKAVGQLNSMSIVMTDISYCKLGSSGGVSWDPVANNDIEDSSGITITDLIVSEDSNAYYIPIEYTDNTAKSITECGIFNSSDEMKFYMYCGEIYKRSDVGYNLYFRINKIVS